MTWSDAARRAALESRRAKAHGRQAHKDAIKEIAKGRIGNIRATALPNTALPNTREQKQYETAPKELKRFTRERAIKAATRKR